MLPEIKLMWCSLWKNYHHAPTLLALQRLKKLIGYLKSSGNMGMKLSILEFGPGKTRHGAQTFWLLETYTGSDWSANKRHHTSTSCAAHILNGSFTFASSRTQQVVSLSSAESELHSMVSGCSDAIFIKPCLEFLNLQQGHPSTTDWHFSCEDAGAEARGWPYSQSQWKNIVDSGPGTSARSHDGPDSNSMELQWCGNKAACRKPFAGVVKPAGCHWPRDLAKCWTGGVAGSSKDSESAVLETPHEGDPAYDSCGFHLAMKGYFMLRQTATDLVHCWRQVGHEDEYISRQESRIDAVIQKYERLESRGKPTTTSAGWVEGRDSNCQQRDEHGARLCCRHPLFSGGKWWVLEEWTWTVSPTDGSFGHTWESQFGNSSSDGFGGIYENFETALRSSRSCRWDRHNGNGNIRRWRWEWSAFSAGVHYNTPFKRGVNDWITGCLERLELWDANAI